MKNNKVMSGYKQLKKKLAKLKQFKANLPRLIDCSNIYDNPELVPKNFVLGF